MEKQKQWHRQNPGFFQPIALGPSRQTRLATTSSSTKGVRGDVIQPSLTSPTKITFAVPEQTTTRKNKRKSLAEESDDPLDCFGDTNHEKPNIKIPSPDNADSDDEELPDMSSLMRDTRVKQRGPKDPPTSKPGASTQSKLVQQEPKKKTKTPPKETKSPQKGTLALPPKETKAAKDVDAEDIIVISSSERPEPPKPRPKPRRKGAPSKAGPNATVDQHAGEKLKAPTSKPSAPKHVAKIDPFPMGTPPNVPLSSVLDEFPMVHSPSPLKKKSKASHSLEPFPMSTIDLESYRHSADGYPSEDDPIEAVNHSSSQGSSSSGLIILNKGRSVSPGSDDSKAPKPPKRKRSPELKGLVASMASNTFQAAAIDPSKLCPFCDEPLPEFPSKRFIQLVNSIKRKAWPEPRDGNPKGLGAPMESSIIVCQLHHDEAQLIPHGIAKGWPQEIDFEGVPARLEAHMAELKGLVTSPYGCYWETAKRHVLSKGKAKANSMVGQMETFRDAQPGYYGETGSIVIHFALLAMFPPTKIARDAIEPLSGEDFIRRVLVPEAAVLLVQDDLWLSRDEAIKVVRDSRDYGQAMFQVQADQEGKDGLPFNKPLTKAASKGTASASTSRTKGISKLPSALKPPQSNLKPLGSSESKSNSAIPKKPSSTTSLSKTGSSQPLRSTSKPPVQARDDKRRLRPPAPPPFDGELSDGAISSSSNDSKEEVNGKPENARKAGGPAIGRAKPVQSGKSRKGTVLPMAADNSDDGRAPLKQPTRRNQPNRIVSSPPDPPLNRLGGRRRPVAPKPTDDDAINITDGEQDADERDNNNVEEYVYSSEEV